MTRALRFNAFLLAALMFHGGVASAQYGYMYPRGYGGWGGWGWGGQTAYGDEARGLGVLAQGVGIYNQETAQARAINTDTTMRFNEYLWESQQIRNQMYYKQLAARRKRTIESGETIYKRLRDNPETADVESGDALNVAFDQITAPNVYANAMREAQVEVPSAVILQIPFTKASEGLTMSLDELTDEELWPDALKGPTSSRNSRPWRRPPRPPARRTIRATCPTRPSRSFRPPSRPCNSGSRPPSRPTAPSATRASRTSRPSPA